MPFDFHFPKVLKELKYASQVTPRDYSAVTVDGEKMLVEYWQEMYLGVQYEHFVASSDNRDNPNSLMPSNLTNARHLHARGFSDGDLLPVLLSSPVALAKIPIDADLFVTNEFDRLAAGLFADLCMIKGVQSANATKILYQKRPRLFPILDQHARRAFNIPWSGSGNDNHIGFVRVFIQALQQVRAIAKTANNGSTLQSLAEISCDITGGILLSSVRIMDIIAWMAVGQSRR